MGIIRCPGCYAYGVKIMKTESTFMSSRIQSVLTSQALLADLRQEAVQPQVVGAGI